MQHIRGDRWFFFHSGLPLVCAKIHYQIGEEGSIADPYPCDVKKSERETWWQVLTICPHRCSVECHLCSIMLTLTQTYRHKVPVKKKGWVQIEHPPYSPDLNPPDFILFPRLKLALKGKRSEEFPGIQ
ncbi:hypothetical protein TNCV_2319801 [Trichonephila clavipes]|nr:hypothetical protein TNCV_2319801 [Trichonephila clavipes]